MRQRRKFGIRRDTPTLDVTAFLSLMVILVPFLLMTAVFSRITILEIENVATQEAAAVDQKALQLVVTVRESTIEVDTGVDAAPVQLASRPDAVELSRLADLAVGFKHRHPDILQATVLVEPAVSYERVVQVLDVIRRQENRENDVSGPQADLFPLVSLGEIQPRQPGTVAR